MSTLEQCYRKTNASQSVGRSRGLKHDIAIFVFFQAWKLIFSFSRFSRVRGNAVWYRFGLNYVDYAAMKLTLALILKNKFAYLLSLQVSSTLRLFPPLITSVQYCGGCSVLWGYSISTCGGDNISTAEAVQYCGGIASVLRGDSISTVEE